MGTKGLSIDHMFIQSYKKAKFDEADNHSRDFPYFVNTLLDESFKIKPSIVDWQLADYDDSEWGTTTLPHPHGGERFKDESLYLRKEIVVSAIQKSHFNL